ncbi:MAG: DUF4127 family protein, partial [Vulcanimicrobiaceae bacterium]
MAMAFLLSLLVTFVPMYATPTAAQLPVMLGRIAGVSVVEPPARLLGDYVAPGDSAAIARWLSQRPQAGAQAFVISSDMLAYGGLDASRVPGGVSTAQAVRRLHLLRALRQRHLNSWIGLFGTVMRLEPTAVTQTGEAVHYAQIAQYPTWEYLWQYAQLHDPLLPRERPTAAQLETLIGPSVLQQYRWTRRRDRAVDLATLQLARTSTVDRLVLGQDDAGPVGLHVKDVLVLHAAVARWKLAQRASIEPGADELGLALVAHAIARSIRWTPRVAIVYSRQDGAFTQDPLEYAPVGKTISALIRLCGAVQDDAHPDLTLFVRVPNTSPGEDDAFVDGIEERLRSGASTALVDLTFLNGSYAPRAAFVRRMLDLHIAGKLDAYSSWNTDANSVGIAISEAIAAGAGRRTGRYDPPAHAAFMLDRFIDDDLYQTKVRPMINAELSARGVTEHYWLAPSVARKTESRVRELLLSLARTLAAQLYPRYRAVRLDVSLPWPRTFEIQSEIRFEHLAAAGVGLQGFPFAGAILIVSGRRMSRVRRLIARSVAHIAALFASLLPVVAAADWPSYRHDLDNSGAIAGPARVTAVDLQPLWYYRADSRITSSPTVAGGTVFAGTWNGGVLALGAQSGSLLWSAALGANSDMLYGGPRGVIGAVAVDDGVAYAVSGSCTAGAFAAGDGRERWRRQICTTAKNDDTYASPAVTANEVLLGIDVLADRPTDRGYELALDKRTGTVLWTFHPQRYAGTGAGISATPAVDPSLGMAFVGTGNPTPLGKPLPGPDAYSESICALDLRDGRLAWAFGPIHPHDTRDEDLFSSPNIFTVDAGGRTRRLVGEAGKDGVYYAVDERTGQLDWERAVAPQSSYA